ncbi:MAG: (2Fe-2S) ferredoxin domain-containing protein [Archangium sp.]|nr:(2Fe-2S) ferredoxin domain-containing protein [Archangium sp.]
MAPPYQRHLFVCTNRRPDGSPKGCCATKGSEALRLAFKKELEAQGVASVRANGAGCLDACEVGAACVVYPEGVWYGRVTEADVKEIVQQHFVQGQPVERLRVQFPIVKKTDGQ